MIDITERKVADEELVKYRKHLEEMVESRTAKLKTVNEQLRQKIVERKEVEEEIKNVAKFPAENPYPVLRVAQMVPFYMLMRRAHPFCMPGTAMLVNVCLIPCSS